MHRHPPHSLPDRAPGPSLPGSRSLTPQTFLDVLSTPRTARKADPLDPPVPNSPLSYWPLLTLTPEPAPPLQTPAAMKLAWHCPSQSASQPAPVPCWGVCVLHPGPCHAFPPVCCVRTCKGGKTPQPRPKAPREAACPFCSRVASAKSRDLTSKLRMLLAQHPQGRSSSSVEDKSDICIVPKVTEGGLSGGML